MTGARLALVATATLFAFALGWTLAPSPSSPVTVSRGLRLADLRLEAPAARAASAAAELARGRGVLAPTAAPAAETRPAVAAPAPPPAAAPPQADAVLRSRIAAVEGADGDLRLVLSGAQRLKAGDGFMGWRVATLSRSAAVLARGGERRTVDFFGAAPRGEGAAIAPAAPGAVRLAAPRVEGARAPPSAAEYFSGFKG